MPFRTILTVLAVLTAPRLVSAQFFDPPKESKAPAEKKPAAEQRSEEKPAGGGGGSREGSGLPSFDPGSEIVSFDGKLWNITDNRIFQARFEKYLSAPESPEAEDAQYRRIISEILAALSPNRGGGPNLPKAVALLPVASQSPIDAHLCDSLANAVYTVWVSQRRISEMARTEEELRKMVDTMHWNFDVAGGAAKTGRDREGNDRTPKAGAVARYVGRIAELEALRKASAAKREVTEIQSKLQFQSLMVSFLLQRRFEHLLISTRMYRVLFGASDQSLKLEEGSAAHRVFSRGAGQNPTVSMLDSMASEIIRDVDEGVNAFRFLVDQGDLYGASRRLSEAFAVGEYLAQIRTLPRKEKQKVQTFVRDSNALVNAMEVRDFEAAGEIVGRLKAQARDFDATRPEARIREASIAAQLLIDKARLAALQGADIESISADIEKAREIWPTNPALKEVSAMFARGGGQAATLQELETLVAQQNYRVILADQARFSAAVSGNPDLEGKLRDVLEKVRKLDMAVAQSDQFAAAGNELGAWEVLEKAAQWAPMDGEINRRRAALAGPAAALSSAIAKARRFEEQGELGPALTWYLRAQSLYPPGILAREGIESISGRILDGPPAAPPPSGPALSGEPDSSLPEIR